MCKNWPDFPISIFGAIGGLIGNTLIICGGGDYSGSYSDECYSLTSEEVTLFTHMSVARYDAASIVLDDKTMWVTGGYSYGQQLDSTEYVTVTGTMPGPDLPLAIFDHAMVAINSTFSMIIGGYSVSSTFFYDHNGGEWINGPSLEQERYSHAAGIIKDEDTDEQFVAVTGGGKVQGGLDSTEVLQDGEWVEGKINT